MFRGKKTQDSVSKAPGVVSVRAAKGFMLPLFYQGSIIHISEAEAIEIDVNELEHEPKIQFEQALAEKHIIEETK